ncbi:unnamed protein product [Rangifer tarandus platyrhynchus]|uniref:Uncharacterized protein n=1 Tax=Rangifer tarandus platyrhynchus TaxID=3082113 RepID=A0AC59ZY02_RANTA
MPRHISGQLRPPTSPGQPRIQGLPPDVPPGAGATKLGGACSLPPPLVTHEDTALLVCDFRGGAAGPQDRDLHILPDPKRKTLTVVTSATHASKGPWARRGFSAASGGPAVLVELGSVEGSGLMGSGQAGGLGGGGEEVVVAILNGQHPDPRATSSSRRDCGLGKNVRVTAVGGGSELAEDRGYSPTSQMCQAEAGLDSPGAQKAWGQLSVRGAGLL